ncbi:hypothetical protein B0H13DRAFT_1871638 [Mycena leptocephala]|nr:hypothetical protein B0H13DRAFT_1871638 [Mycena leptocephala]
MAVFPDAYATDTVRSLTLLSATSCATVCGISSATCFSQRRFVRMSSVSRTSARDSLGGCVDVPYHTGAPGRRGVRWGGQAVVNIGDGPEETTDGRIAHAQAGFLLGAALSTFLAKKKSGDEAHLDFPERLVGRHLQVQRDYRLLARDWNRGDCEETFVWTHCAYSCLVRGDSPEFHRGRLTPLLLETQCERRGSRLRSNGRERDKENGTRRSMRVLAAGWARRREFGKVFLARGRRNKGATAGTTDRRGRSPFRSGEVISSEYFSCVLHQIILFLVSIASQGVQESVPGRGKQNKGADATPIVSLSIFSNYAPAAWLANYRHYLERLLLSVEELSDPHWEPDTSIDVFLQARVRPAVYFLQRCAVGEGGLQGAPVDIPASEKEELRLLALRLAGTVRFLSACDAPGISLENYRVPGCAANMMSIIMVLLGRLCDVEDRDRQALSICLPILQEFRATAMATARLDHTDTEYPQFHRNGLLRELFYEIDLVPEDFALRILCLLLLPKPVSMFCNEFLNCDFPTVGQMVDFAHHPFMARVSREILEPLYQFFLRIREDFTWSPESKTKGEKRVMQQRVRDYLEMAGRLSDYVIRHHDLAEANRIPTPRVAWLQVVMRADSVYGFEGDDNQLLRVILRGKIASLLQYSERLRQHAVDRIVEKDDEVTRAQRPSIRKSENPLYGLLGVIEEGEVEAMETMDSYCGVCIEAFQLASTKFAHVEYVREHLRPLCELIRGCIPSAVTVPDDLPDGRAEFLRPYVGAYLEKAAFLYSAALEYAKSNSKRRFSIRRYSQECCDAFLSRISSALSFTDRTRTSASRTDVPLSAEIASLPHVPLWTRERINHLCILELNDAWTCENALLQDEIEASQGIGRGLEKAVAQAEAGYRQSPSGQYFVRFSKEELVILWIHRSRHLAQQLHRTTRAAPVAETPEATVGLIRDAVSVLLKNMVALGKASITYGEYAEGEEPAFFVPSEGTTLFGMAERFVDLYGFHEDSSLLAGWILMKG